MNELFFIHTKTKFHLFTTQFLTFYKKSPTKTKLNHKNVGLPFKFIYCIDKDIPIWRTDTLCQDSYIYIFCISKERDVN